VYDGLPAYVGRYAAGSRLLGSLCTEDVPEDGDLRLEASSGIMTVHYSEVCVSHVFRIYLRSIPDPKNCFFYRSVSSDKKILKNGLRSSFGSISGSGSFL
jgi:hypothetical protein